MKQTKYTPNQAAAFLLKALEQTAAMPAVKQDPGYVAALNQTASLLRDDLFRIAVVGEFSSGKSTFINALLGKDILRHATSETTAAITHIYNVAEKDPRCGSCEIRFRDGSVKKLNTLDQLSAYTTVQSGDHVAEKVELVTVYCHFLATKHPIMVIDTPGLNGIAEGHREITLREIEKAHTCIYLLTSKGLSLSDTDFLSLVLQSQTSVLFLQNFKDKLNAAEGDTIERKIAEDDRLIQEKLLPKQKKLRYHIIGISALKAVAAKDTSVQQLYSDDQTKLTDADRKKLYQDSNFTEMEQYLAGLIDSGEYRAMIIEGAMQRSLNILDDLLTELDIRQQLAQQQRAADDDTKRAVLAETTKQKLLGQMDDRKERLRNFIVSQADKDQRLLRMQLKEQLEALAEQMKADVEKQLPNYEALEAFAVQHDKQKPTVYYKNQLNQQVQEIFRQIRGDADLFLSRLKELAMQRVLEYSGKSVSTERIPIKLPEIGTTFSVDMETEQEFQSGVAAEKAKIAKSEEKIRRQNETMRKLSSELTVAKSQVGSAKSNYQQAEKAFQRKLSAMGARPNVDRWETIESKEVPREGFLAKTRDKWFGMQTVQYTVQHSDDSERRRWERKRSAEYSKWNSQKRQLEEQIDEAESKYDDLEAQKEDCERSIRKEMKRIDEARGAMEEVSKIYEMRKKMQKQKWFHEYRNTLQQNIEDTLTDVDSSTSAYADMEGRIGKVYRQAVPVIQQHITATYEKTTKERIRELEQLIKESNTALSQRYQGSEAELEQIAAFRNQICEKFGIVNKEEK